MGPGDWQKTRAIVSTSRRRRLRLQIRFTAWLGVSSLQGGGRGLDAGDLRAGLSELAVVYARDEPARLAPPHPHESEHRPRPPRPADPDQQPLEESDYFLYNRIEAATGETDEERVLERLSQDHIAEALAAVPHDFRDVVVLVDIGDFSYADAAQILDIPIGTVMSRLHRGRRILKKELADVAVET